MANTWLENERKVTGLTLAGFLLHFACDKKSTFRGNSRRARTVRCGTLLSDPYTDAFRRIANAVRMEQNDIATRPHSDDLSR